MKCTTQLFQPLVDTLMDHNAKDPATNAWAACLVGQNQSAGGVGEIYWAELMDRLDLTMGGIIHSYITASDTVKSNFTNEEKQGNLVNISNQQQSIK